MSQHEAYLQTLEDSRRSFREELGERIIGREMTQRLKKEGFFDTVLSAAMWPYENSIDEVLHLIVGKSEEELKRRKEFVKQYIDLKGLSRFQDEIIEGMNKTCKRVRMWDDSPKTMPLSQQRTILHHDSSALLRFSLNYVDRWKMYNELFGNSDTSQIF